MRYTIGLRIYSNSDKKFIEGLFSYINTGFPSIYTGEKDVKGPVDIPIFDNLTDANKFLVWLQKVYSYEFKSNKKKNPIIKNNDERIYLLKVDTPKSMLANYDKKLNQELKLSNYPHKVPLYRIRKKVLTTK